MEVAALNRSAQAERLLKGELGSSCARVGDETVFAQDRVIFGRNSLRYGVKNGTMATVLDVQNLRRTSRLDVELDGERGRVVTIDLGKYEHVKLGYACTVHRAQGLTTGNAYVLAGGSMTDLHMAYVMASRAKQDTHVFIDRIEAGEDLKTIAWQMSRSNAKDLASDHLPQAAQTKQREQRLPAAQQQQQLQQRLTLEL